MISIFPGYIMKLPNEKAFKEQTARGKLLSCLLLVKEKDRLKEKRVHLFFFFGIYQKIILKASNYNVLRLLNAFNK